MKEYIEREAVLAEIDKAFNLFVEHDDIIRLYSDARSSVIYAPAADVVERKRGEWVVVEDRPITFYECSLCNDRWHYGAVLHMNFCPSCGADMRGE